MKTGDIICMIICFALVILFVGISVGRLSGENKMILDAVESLQVQQVAKLPPAQVAPKGINDLLRAMAIEENGSTADSDELGDNKKSLGPLQICWKYWDDADMPDGTYNDCVSYKYACRVAIRYWKRYCPEALAKVDCKVLVRIHNGGPTGNRKSSTLGHWAKVQKELGR